MQKYDEVVKTINELHSQYKKKDEEIEAIRTEKKFVAIELGSLLKPIKDDLGHGNWGKWLKANCNFTQATAITYIKAFESAEELEQSDLNLTDFINSKRKKSVTPKAVTKKDEPKEPETPPKRKYNKFSWPSFIEQVEQTKPVIKKAEKQIAKFELKSENVNEFTKISDKVFEMKEILEKLNNQINEMWSEYEDNRQERKDK
ncbi:MAG: DUF3102 domain-containing protein [Pseudomonadota bacterium]